MNKIIKRQSFYVELSLDEIKIATRQTVSLYPIWLGKNRAIIRDVVACFDKTQPETLYECLHIIGHYGLNGQSTNEKPINDFFLSEENAIDKHKKFW